MTEHQIEQVTPRIHPANTNQEPRTWQQPKIRLHNSVQSTLSTLQETSQPRHFRTIRVRVTAPSDNLSYEDSPFPQTTPVTHPTLPKPQRFRIAGAQPEANGICRQLFPNSTPAKRPRHATHSFRVSCGRERTQPSQSGSRSYLADELDAQIEQAQINLRNFRNGMSGPCTDASFRTAIRDGLLFEISRRQDNILVLKPFPLHSDEHCTVAAIVITDEMFSEQMNEASQVDYSRHIVYIPYPWHAQLVDDFSLCNIRIQMLIAAHKVAVFGKEQLASLANLAVNSALDMLPCFGASIPDRQETGSPQPRQSLRFSALSPHMSVTSLSVFVDFYDASYQLAVIRDETGELAVLTTASAELEVSPRRIVLSNVSILPYRVLSHVILEVIGDKSDDRLDNLLVMSGPSTSYMVFKHEESLEKENS